MKVIHEHGVHTPAKRSAWNDKLYLHLFYNDTEEGLFYDLKSTELDNRSKMNMNKIAEMTSTYFFLYLTGFIINFLFCHLTIRVAITALRM